MKEASKHACIYFALSFRTSKLLLECCRSWCSFACHEFRSLAWNTGLTTALRWLGGLRKRSPPLLGMPFVSSFIATHILLYLVVNKLLRGVA